MKSFNFGAPPFTLTSNDLSFFVLWRECVCVCVTACVIVLGDRVTCEVKGESGKEKRNVACSLFVSVFLSFLFLSPDSWQSTAKGEILLTVCSLVSCFLCKEF